MKYRHVRRPPLRSDLTAGMEAIRRGRACTAMLILKTTSCRCQCFPPTVWEGNVTRVLSNVVGGYIMGLPLLTLHSWCLQKSTDCSWKLMNWRIWGIGWTVVYWYLVYFFSYIGNGYRIAVYLFNGYNSDCCQILPPQWCRLSVPSSLPYQECILHHLCITVASPLRCRLCPAPELPGCQLSHIKPDLLPHWWAVSDIGARWLVPCYLFPPSIQYLPQMGVSWKAPSGSYDLYRPLPPAT